MKWRIKAGDQRANRQAVAMAEWFARELRLPGNGTMIGDQDLINEAVRLTGIPMTLLDIDLSEEDECYAANVVAQVGDPHRYLLLDTQARHRVVRIGMVAHEIAHCALQHRMRPLRDISALIQQLPGLNPNLVTMLGTRCMGTTSDPELLQQEHEVELFTGVLVDAILPDRRQPTPSAEFPGLHRALGS